MTKEERLDNKLANKETIVLSYNSDIIKLLIYSLLLFSICSIFLIFNIFRIRIESLVISISIIFLNYIVIKNLKKIVSASIQGDMLMTKNIFNRKKITSVKSIKSISSSTIFHINFTQITFKLDGAKHNVHIIRKIDEEHLDNETIIKASIKKAS